MSNSTINIYPSVIHSGGPGLGGNDLDNVCNEIHAATKGFGTSEKRLLKALGGSTAETRCMIPARYFQLYNKSLLDVIKSECGNKVFGTALQYLAVDPVHAECLMIDDACQGFGTDEKFLFSIICGRSNADIAALKNKYQQLYGKSLERKIGVELSGHMDFLAKWVLEGKEEEYDANTDTTSKAEQDAEKMRSMGEGRWGSNENGIVKLICKSSPKYLQLLNSKYEEKYGHDLVKAMEKELNGKLEKGILTVLQMKLNPYEQVARMIHNAYKGIGTRELLLTTYMIRYQFIMKEVDSAHQSLYKKSIKNLVKFETSGDYERLLVEIVDVN